MAISEAIRRCNPLAPNGSTICPRIGGVRRLRTVAEMRVSNVDKHVEDGELPVLLCNYVDVYKNDRITEDIAFVRATAVTAETERFRLEVGEVLFTNDSETWIDIGVLALVEYTADDSGLIDISVGPDACSVTMQESHISTCKLFLTSESASIPY